jgi:hypothetical protein
MHSSQHSQILWASIVASAAVAALVTLLVEYLAKPQLEARKERILEKNQQRRTALLGLRRIANLPQRIAFYKVAEALGEFASSEDDAPPAADGRERMHIAIMEAQDLLVTAFELLAPSSSYLKLWQGEVGAVMAYLSFIVVDPNQKAPKFATLIVEGLTYYADLFTLSWWRWRRRYSLLKKIKEIDTWKDRQWSAA